MTLSRLCTYNTRTWDCHNVLGEQAKQWHSWSPKVQPHVFFEIDPTSTDGQTRRLARSSTTEDVTQEILSPNQVADYWLNNFIFFIVFILYAYMEKVSRVYKNCPNVYQAQPFSSSSIIAKPLFPKITVLQLAWTICTNYTLGASNPSWVIIDPPTTL